MSEKSFINKLNKIADTNAKLPLRLASRAVLFSKNRFRQQNWVDTSVEPWEPRKKNKYESRDRQKRGTLIDTGRLFKSIRKLHWSHNSIIIGTDVPYARAHNEGFNGTVQVKKHTRERNGRVYKVKAHTKQMHLPRRQFMGASKALSNRLAKMIAKEYKKALR